MSAVYSITALIFAIFTTATKAAVASASDYDFKIFTCGALGGAYARELTSFFIAETSEEYNFLSMDAGTSLDCIDVAAKKFSAKPSGSVSPLFDSAKQSTLKFGPKGAATTKGGEPKGLTGYFRQKQLNGFLVTHAHADHQTGLVISSAEDDFQHSRKPVIAPKNTVAGLLTQLSPPLWPGNFFYTLIEHNPEDGEKSLNAMAAANIGKSYPPHNKLVINHWAASKFWIKSYFLSHDTGESTAYRICNDPIATATACVLFFGDTGPDDDEINGPWPFPTQADRKKEKWFPEKIAEFKKAANIEKVIIDESIFKTNAKYTQAFLPLRHVWDDNIKEMQSGVLNTIFIESSYSDERIKKDKTGLFGHLTPKLILDELAYIGGKFSRINTVPITVAVMHLKPTWNAKTVKTATALGASATAKATGTLTVPKTGTLTVPKKLKSKKKTSKSKSKKKTSKSRSRKKSPVKTATGPPTDGLTALIDTLDRQLFIGARAIDKSSGKSVNDLVMVAFRFPTSEDMIYVKGKAQALYKKTSSAVPGYAPKGRVAAPRGDYYKNDYDYNGGYHTNGHSNNNEGYGLFAAEIVLVLALVCVVGLCFIVGLTFGGGVMWMAMIKKRKEKRTN